MAARSKANKTGKGRQDADALTAALAKSMKASILPGDTPFAKDRLAEAAQFLFETARNRKPGTPAIAIRSGADRHRYMSIAIINDDMPFLVDSVAAAIAAHGLAIDRMVHPILSVQRSAKGTLSCLSEEQGSFRESMIYVETPRLDALHRRKLCEMLEVTLADVRAAVKDWPAMQALMAEDSLRLGDSEGAELLRWLAGGMLTQLGHVTRHRDGSHSDLLGICRKSARGILAEATFERAFEWFEQASPPDIEAAPLVVKANRISRVHRRVPPDLFIVPVVKDGHVTALSVHAGIWTSAALSAPPDTVPRLRRQMSGLLDRLGFDPANHDGKALLHAFAALPHDLLIGFDDEAVEQVVTSMMALSDRPRPRVVLICAPLERHLFAFVWFPRDMLSMNIRPRVMAMLEKETGGKVIDWGLAIEGGNLAAMRFVIDIREGPCSADVVAIDDALQTMLRGWPEAVEDELSRQDEYSRAAALSARYANAFPPAYHEEYGPAEAARDILRLRSLQSPDSAASEGRDARLYRLPADSNGKLRLKLYQLSGQLPLSDAVPALENFGFHVLSEVPTVLDGGELGTIHDFTLALPSGEDAAVLLERAETIEEAISAVLNGAAENDVFNRLILGAALSARETDLLRAYYRYLRQAGISYTIYTVVDAFNRAPAIARALVALFEANHDPARKSGRDKAQEKAEHAIRDGLSKVETINDDRILRLYHAVIDATLRTNAFAPAASEALAFKLDSAAVPGLPRPVPWREIFVYSRRVEGIHLRSGAVARGGIRWSDRRDDFRTEILGLMKAQRVKNAVIVPTGAKGGFYPKQLHDPRRDREAWAAEGKACYQIFIRSMLSLTDNVVDDRIVHPDGIVVHDGEDPYFVVAADKGTASFSDLANAIAAQFDFWLDDAFASGGSKGYDHKAMGITARGAWISVQRHFLEMGVDVQKEPVRVAGCGDMSGDVFGNGMLLSKAIKLVAAFDHRHIFIDPDPDPAASWKERKRLFGLKQSSWDDYDRKLLSKGGGIFPRTQKRIQLSEQARRLLGTDAQEMDPDALISAMLRAPVDLLWFGGIGTYVKAAAESNGAVGDPANDALRVNGADIRAQVIGEGANLGVTQAGRIEFARNGGRINADFIDNSAGVDCSDNEVNIKIAFAAAKRAGRLSEARREKLLVEMTDEVAAIVLEDNRLQALGLSIAQAGGARAMPSFTRLIEKLEERGMLDRKTEGLEDNQTLARLAADGIGLTRPELAVLLSSTKLALQDAIEKSSLPDDEQLLPTLINAFPQTMQGAFRKQILSHRLRRELVATKLANRIVNRLGLLHAFELAEEESAELGAVAGAFVCAEELFDMDRIWTRIETADMPEVARIRLFDRASASLADHMADLLRMGECVYSPARLIAELAPGVNELSRNKARLMKKEAHIQSEKMRDGFVAIGAPAAEAAIVAHLYDLDGTPGIARLAQDCAISVNVLAAAFIDLGARLGLDWAQRVVSQMNPSDPWERLLVNALARDFQHMRLDFLRRVTKREKDPMAAIERWTAAHADAIGQFRSIIGRGQGAVSASPAMLAQIASQARNLLMR